MGKFEFDRIASEVFFPIYEVLAQECVKETGISQGTAIDLGCGGGHLGLSLLKMTSMDLILYDISPDALEIARDRAREWGLADRTETVLGDVQNMAEIKTGSVDLAVSRGSVGFWPDTAMAFGEIYRVLKPGGKTFIGGGFGTEELEAEITEKMKVYEPEWPDCVRKKTNGYEVQDYARILSGLGFKFRIVDDERGMWIVVEKPALEKAG